MPERDRITPLLERLDRLDRVFEAGERGVLAGGVLAMAAVAIANVFARNVLGASLAFADELSQILLILVTFLGIGYGVRHARHIRMSAVYDQLAGRPRKGLMFAIHVGTAAVLLAFCVYAVRYVAWVHAAGSVTPALRIPWYLIYLWVPVGFALGGIQHALAALRNLTARGVHLSFREEDRYHDAGAAG